MNTQLLRLSWGKKLLKSLPVLYISSSSSSSNAAGGMKAGVFMFSLLIRSLRSGNAQLLETASNNQVDWMNPTVRDTCCLLASSPLSWVDGAESGVI